MSEPSDLPPDLPRLHVLETFLVLTLARVRERITHLEQQEAIRSRAERQQPPPEWTLEISINGQSPIGVHAGDCRMGGSQVRTRQITREQAARALAEGVEACRFCRPDSELGILHLCAAGLAA
ncbi:DUF6233 domain-containing protein [Streptomyces sp. NPDC002133]|uniref:DUF6233 domain-containing protein n=1 Tax=Streptomyces sp. NPDC002133 TaxID=3154409 RepID=UPI0033267026